MWIDDLIRLLPRDLRVQGTPEAALQRLERTLGRPLPATYRQFALWAGDTPPPFLELQGHDLSLPPILADYAAVTFHERTDCFRVGLSDSPDRFDLFLGLDGDDPALFMAETHELPAHPSYFIADHFSEFVTFALFERLVLARCAYHVRVAPQVTVDVRAELPDVDAAIHNHLRALGYDDLPPNRRLFLMARGDVRLAYHRLPSNRSFVLHLGAPDLAAAEQLRDTLPVPAAISPASAARR